MLGEAGSDLATPLPSHLDKRTRTTGFPCLGTPAGGPWLLASSLGAALGEGRTWGDWEAQIFSGSCSLWGQKNSGVGAQPSVLPLRPHSNYGHGVGVGGGKKTPTPRFPPQAPTSLYLFIYLGKGPTAQAGNGPIPGGSAGLGNKEPHCALCPAAPHPGPAAGAQRGGSAWGPGRKEAWGSKPAVHERASVRGRAGGCRVPTPPGSRRSKDAGQGVAPCYGLGPSWHRPARSGETPRSRLATAPPPLPKQMPPLRGGDVLPLASPPWSQFLPGSWPNLRPPCGEACRLESPVVRALPWLMRAKPVWRLMSPWGHSGRAGPSPALDSSLPADCVHGG